jgi:hypothetical protein|tara:strand:+ start:792 stop:1085 length:294 start_codon:yes stop_codon:yes gene_type:complete
MNEIKIVRISTGEELLCTVDSSKSYKDTLMLSDVAILIPTEANSLGLAPFMAYSNAPNGMEIKRSFVMFVVDPVDALKKQYQTMFSKIITNDSKLIL